MQDFLTPDFIKFFIPLVGAVLAWLLNERRRRAWEEYLRKEDRYQKLLKSLSGFYVHAANPDARYVFIEEYKKCWMYCADEVITAANAAIHATKEGTTISNDERLKIIGALVLAIRRDMLRRTLVRKTKLSPDDYIHMSPGR